MQEFRPSGFQVLPPIVKNILIINGLVLMAQTFIGNIDANPPDYITNTFALHSWHSPLFKPWQPVTYMFMHGGFTHFLFNMFAVWMFGSILENMWGARRFLIFYIVCGLGAAFAQLLVLHFQQISLIHDWAQLKPPHDFTVDEFKTFYIEHIRSMPIDQTGVQQVIKSWSADPNNRSYAEMLMDFTNRVVAMELNSGATMGASGAVFGLLVAFGYLFPNTLISLYFFIPIKAKWFVLGYAAVELFLAFQNSATDNVAHVAHLGGALVGFILVYFWNKTNRRQFY